MNLVDAGLIDLRHVPAAPPKRRKVLAHGCFDLLHLGHIRHLQEAKSLGDWLVVSVTDDAYVRKGVGRPWFTVEQRVEALRALDCVDEVIVNPSGDAVGAIERIRPAVYVKGLDYAKAKDAALAREIAAVTAHGGVFHVTHTDKWSSSRILNGERLSEDAIAYLDGIRSKGFSDLIAQAFERADRLKIAFVGETIIDEYRYVSPLGKPVKECCLATVETTTCDVFEGGVIAAAKHADWRNAHVVTNAHAAIRKTRFVDAAFNRKLFEVYSDRDVELIASQRAKFQIALQEEIDAADVVVVLDFGHGLIGAPERALLQRAKFLAVNAQTNTGNFGFNPVTKYTRADYVCVDDPEARLATGMQYEGAHIVVAELARRVGCDKIAVTHGRNGCLTYCVADGFPKSTPAFATNGVDTMGAGDAYLAATAPLIAIGLDLEAAALVGNVAGAIKVGILGHQRHVGREELLQTVEALLK